MSLVFHPQQAQAPRRQRHGYRVLVVPVQHLLHLLRCQPVVSYVDQRSGHPPDLVRQERAAFDLQRHHAPVLPYREPGNLPDGTCARPVRPAREAGEVVAADKVARRASHPPDVERADTWWLVRLVRGDRTGPLSIVNAYLRLVAIRRGSKSSGTVLRLPHDDIRRQVVVERPQENLFRVRRGRVERDDLPAGMDTGVRAAGSLDPDSLPCESMDGLFQLLLYRAGVGLVLEPVVVGAVVLYQQGKPHGPTPSSAVSARPLAPKVPAPRWPSARRPRSGCPV